MSNSSVWTSSLHSVCPRLCGPSVSVYCARPKYLQQTGFANFSNLARHRWICYDECNGTPGFLPCCWWCITDGQLNNSLLATSQLTFLCGCTTGGMYVQYGGSAHSAQTPSHSPGISGTLSLTIRVQPQPTATS